MPQGDALIIMSVGGVFILLGILALYWGRREERDYNTAISTRADDMREFMEHWPPRPQVGAPKIGGWIAVAVGIMMTIAGVVLWLAFPQI